MTDDYVWHVERAKDVHARRLLRHTRHIVIAHQHKDRNFIGELFDAFGELTLLSRVGVAGFKSISGEDDQIGIVIESVGDNFIEPI